MKNKLKVNGAVWAGIMMIIAIIFNINSVALAVTHWKIPASQDEARTILLAETVEGNRSVSSQTIDWSASNTVTYANAPGTNAENVVTNLLAQHLTYRVINSNDLIYGYMWLYDQDGNNTFFGYSSFTASSRATNKPIYNVSMQNFPLFTNVSSAQVLALDSDGRTATPYEVMVNSKGHVLLQGWMMGSLNGLLSVRYKDGSVTNYNLWSTNSSSPPVIVESGESAKFEGHTIAELNSTNGATLNIMEVWNLPTVYIKVPVGQSVMLNVLGLAYDQNGQYFERPYGMTVRYDNGSEVELPLDPTQAVSTFFPAGNYRLRFKWKEFLKPGTIYTGPGSGTKG